MQHTMQQCALLPKSYLADIFVLGTHSSTSITVAHYLEMVVASTVHGLFARVLADALSCRLFSHGLPHL